MNPNNMLYQINRDLDMLIGIYRREHASKAVFTRAADIKRKAILLSALTCPDVNAIPCDDTPQV